MFFFFFIYFVTFFSIFMFTYGTIRALKDLAQAPLVDEYILEEGRFKRNPVYRVSMFLTRLLARFNLNLNLGAYETLLKKKLDAAGRPFDLKPMEYLAFKQLSAFLVGLLGIGLHLTMAGHRFPLFNALIMIGFGYMAPNMYVNALIRKRQISILRDLPFSCDLLTLSVEAGLDFSSALEKVVTNGPPGPLQDELHVVLQETRIGKTRREALSDFGSRIQMQEVTNFVGAITQADRMGTGFANVLRLQSLQIRNGRFERAEKMAQKLPVKILFPIIIVNLLSIAIILVIPLLSTITNYIH